MITIYTIDAAGVYFSEQQHDPKQPLPRCSLTPPPVTTGTEVAYLSGSTWTVLPEYPQQPAPTPEQMQASEVRAERNKLLAESDWTQVADAPVDKAAWATYRQALRDISSQAGFPWNVEWPQMP